MRKKKVIMTLTIAALALTGCGTGGSPENDDNAGGKSKALYERSITLTDGRDVTCVVYGSGHAGGLSCDWENAQ